MKSLDIQHKHLDTQNQETFLGNHTHAFDGLSPHIRHLPIFRLGSSKLCEDLISLKTLPTRVPCAPALGIHRHVQTSSSLSPRSLRVPYTPSLRPLRCSRKSHLSGTSGR